MPSHKFSQHRGISFLSCFSNNEPVTLSAYILKCYRSTGQLKCDGTRAETRFRLSAKRTNPFKSAGASVQSTTDSRGVRISGSNAGYTMFRSSVKGTGCPLHSPVSPSFPSRVSPCAITFQLEPTTATFAVRILRNFAVLTLFNELEYNTMVSNL